MGSSNYFKCPHCGNNTRHVLVSSEEEFGNNAGRVGGIIGKLYDYSGYTKLFQAIGNKVWKCTSCLGLSNRDHGGGIVHVRASWSEGWKDYVEYNGGYYMGDYVNHKRHGRGKFIWASGDVYDGEWHDDKMHGRGKYTWASVSVSA